MFAAEIAGQQATATVSRLKYRLNPDTLEQVAVHTLSLGDVGFCNLSFDRALVFDTFKYNPYFGRITFRDEDDGSLLGFAQIDFVLRRRQTSIGRLSRSIKWRARTLKDSAPVASGLPACPGPANRQSQASWKNACTFLATTPIRWMEIISGMASIEIWVLRMRTG